MTYILIFSNISCIEFGQSYKRDLIGWTGFCKNLVIICINYFMCNADLTVAWRYAMVTHEQGNDELLVGNDNTISVGGGHDYHAIWSE